MWRLLFILSLCPFLGSRSADVPDCECSDGASPPSFCLLEEENPLKLKLEEISTRMRQQSKDLNNLKSMVSNSNGIPVERYSKSVETLIRPTGENVCFSKPMYPNSCNEAPLAQSEIAIIQVPTFPQPFRVYCNMEDHGGGWTVIQRRVDASVDFFLDWASYKVGFGNMKGNFFIGLEKLHALTEAAPQEILFILTDFDNVTKYAKYDDFAIGNESESYALNVLGSYSGNAGDSFSPHKGMKFSTKDKENDVHEIDNCAQLYEGAWWYHKCLHSNLNGAYLGAGTVRFAAGVNWNSFNGLYSSLKTVQIMIRPKMI